MLKVSSTAVRQNPPYEFSLIFSKKTKKPDKMDSVDKEATTEHKNNVIDSQQTMYSPKK